MANQRQIFLQFIFIFIIKTFAANSPPTIDPLQSILTSNDSKRKFLCNGHRTIESDNLLAEIDKSIDAPPKFRLQTQKFNSTTIRVSIFPDGFVGKNRILCFWKGEKEWGAIHDVTIGAQPGQIELKERCQAFNRRYVECVFFIPTVGRAYRNGFKRSYSFLTLSQLDNAFFTEIRSETEINEKNEMIVRFSASNRKLFFRQTAMILSMSIGEFGNGTLKFFIDPIHKTRVVYQIDERTKNGIILLINRTNENSNEPRICSGHVEEIDAKQKSTLEISPTSELKIDVNHLQPSTPYKICLKCYYDESDASFNDETCESFETLPDEPIKSKTLFFISSLFLIIFSALAFFIYLKWKNSREERPIFIPSRKEHDYTEDHPTTNPQFKQPSRSMSNDDDETSEAFIHSTTNENTPELPLRKKSTESNDPKYKPFVGSSVFQRNLFQDLTDRHYVTEDTIDLAMADKNPSAV